MSTDRDVPEREVAYIIADRLFVNGVGQEAHRLVLELPGKRDGGGWCKQAVVDLITDALIEHKGTAESLIRDLARALQAVQWLKYEQQPTHCPICLGRASSGHDMSCDIGRAMSRIPKELRAQNERIL